MRRLAPLALALALLAGTARADTFEIVPTPGAGLSLNTIALPSSDTPNASGLKVTSLTTPPASPQQLSYTQLLGIWQQAGSTYGIPWEVLAAINKIESNFGRNMGPSSAGAVGWMQFMPSTWLRWGTDADGDGVADPWNATDGIFSAARYLAAAGGTSDLYRGVFAYNHADWYVREVLDLAKLYGGDSTIAFTLDGLQEQLDAARTAAAEAGERLHEAQADVAASTREVARWQAKADSAPLLSDRLSFEMKTGLALQQQSVAQARVDELGRSLASAQAELAKAQQASAPSSFAPGASQLLSAPSYSGSYVFPVGGGPGTVFASHTHHDYPAVDIAAPMGAPLYALANGIVVNAWSTPDARCGIGFTMRSLDGQVWTYCHLSVLDPHVNDGASLVAGQSVGLVGATGHATGPHLHLQHHPASSWPQREPWFESFAGKAFTWSDSGGHDDDDPARTLAAVAVQGPVYDVVPAEQPDGVVFFSTSS